MPALPSLLDGLTARPMRRVDLPAVAELLAAAESVDRTGEHPDVEDLLADWDNELVDLARDGLLVTDGAAAVGFATAIAPPTFRGAFGVHLEGRVHPKWRGRGLGRALLQWQLARGAAVHAERHPEAPARLSVPVEATMPSLEGLVRRAALSPDRRYYGMERPLEELPPVPRVDGIDLAPFAWDRDDEVRRAHNLAFADHHGSSERDAASWRVLFTGHPSFRPDLSVLAVDGGAVVGYALVYAYESDTRATGRRTAWFGQIGTLPRARGRGLASAVMAASLRAAAERDCRTAALQVDSENSTGALGLYERLGFVVVRVRTSWVRLLPPLAGRPGPAR